MRQHTKKAESGASRRRHCRTSSRCSIACVHPSTAGKHLRRELRLEKRGKEQDGAPRVPDSTSRFRRLRHSQHCFEAIDRADVDARTLSNVANTRITRRKLGVFVVLFVLLLLSFYLPRSDDGQQRANPETARFRGGRCAARPR